jgi:hypothetical protein
MALKHVEPRPTMAGQVPHDSLKRVDKRVKEIFARREAALKEARLAAKRLDKAKT